MHDPASTLVAEHVRHVVAEALHGVTSVSDMDALTSPSCSGTGEDKGIAPGKVAQQG